MWIKTGKENRIGTGKIIELIEYEVDLGNQKKMFELARRAPWVRMIFEHQDRFLLTREYRGEHDGYDYRLPGGKVFETIEEYRSFDGDILDAARDAALIESKEECGIIVTREHLELLKVSHCGATMEWDLYYFIVRDFELTHEQDLGEGESITYDWYTRDSIIELIQKWEMSEDRSIGVLLLYLIKS